MRGIDLIMIIIDLSCASMKRDKRYVYNPKQKNKDHLS